MPKYQSKFLNEKEAERVAKRATAPHSDGTDDQAAAQAAVEAARVDAPAVDQPAAPEPGLTAEQIATLEAEKAELLARVRARIPAAAPPTSWRREVEAPAEADVEPGKPLPLADMTKRPARSTADIAAVMEQTSRAKARALNQVDIAEIEQDQDAYDRACADVSRLQRELTALAEEHRAAARWQSCQLDPALVARIAVGTDAAVAGGIEYTKGESDATAEFVKMLNARLAPHVKRARRVERKLKEFREAYGQQLAELARLDRKALFGGLPSEGPDAVASVRSVQALQQTVSMTADTLALSEQNLAKQKQALQGLLETVTYRGPWPLQATTADGREVDLVQALHELDMENDDKLAFLHRSAANIAAALEEVRGLKAKYAGQSVAPFDFENGWLVMQDAIETERLTREALPRLLEPAGAADAQGRRTQANVDWNIFRQ